MQKQYIFIKLITLLIKNPKLVAVIFCVSMVLYAYEVFVARDKMVYMGIPKAQEFSLNSWVRIFRNDAYIVGYSDVRGNPLWIAYKLKQALPNTPSLKRPENFSADVRNITFINANDYTNSGYDRGHMAPNHAIALLYGKKAQVETFLMTNITPQKSNLNQKIWQKLEEIELEQFTQKFKEVWVYTGPLFDKNTQRLKSSSWVEIPDAFYKIYIGIKEDGTFKTLSFIIPQNVKPHEKIEKFVVNIDTIEKLSGFDFLHELEDNMENEAEKKVSITDWL